MSTLSTLINPSAELLNKSASSEGLAEMRTPDTNASKMAGRVSIEKKHASASLKKFASPIHIGK
jgi:hypothetical protein